MRLFSVVTLTIGIAIPAGVFDVGRVAAKARDGGTFRMSLPFLDSVDPALAYTPSSWLLLQATCAKLMNYPDKPSPRGLRAAPEVAAGYELSKNRRVYTFKLRSGYRFSSGKRLTAASFKRAISRLVDPAFQSTDPAPGVKYAVDIVGSDAVLAGKASTVSGVVARGDTLVIRLKHPVPDFPARLAMPFFCAVPPSLPADPEGAGAYPSAGPYYIADYIAGRRLVLERNRYYHGKRPHHVDRFIVDLTRSPAEAVDQVERNAADWGFLSGPVFAQRGRELTRKYGGKRLFLRPSGALWYFALNARRQLFRNNARLRRAVNLAIDRAALVRLMGYRAARPTDHYLPPIMGGYKPTPIYPSTGNVTKARRLAHGRLRSGKAVLYTSSDDLRLGQAQLLKQDLASIGLDVQIKAFPLPLLRQRIALPDEPFDIAFTGGWGADYSDPYAYLNVLFEGRRIGRADNLNYAYFNSARYNRLLDQASRMRGAARYRAYGQLDLRLTREAAPIVAYAVSNARTFISTHVDTRPSCFILRPDLDLAAVCLKR
jgi:ABC-type oligopeptide transport system substrate-binding subunit